VTWQAGQTITVSALLDNTPHTVSFTATAAGNAGNTAETVFLTSSSCTMRNGRAYRIEIKGLLSGTSPDTARWFVRRTGLSGTTLLDTQRIAIPSSTSNGQCNFVNYAANQSGADITDVVVWTTARGSGSAANVMVAASSTSPAEMRIEDIGPATDYPTATPIT
jgi:hypothetical protein